MNKKLFSLLSIALLAMFLFTGCAGGKKIFIPTAGMMHIPPRQKYDWQDCVTETSVVFEQKYGYALKIPNGMETVGIIAGGSTIMLAGGLCGSIPGCVPAGVAVLGADKVINEDKSTRENPQYSFRELDAMAQSDVLECFYNKTGSTVWGVSPHGQMHPGTFPNQSALPPPGQNAPPPKAISSYPSFN